MNDTIKKSEKYDHMVGHRGVAGLETENTLKSFENAGKRTYIGLECDIHHTKDDVIVVNHDDSLTRVVGVDMRIPEYTYEDLRKIEFPDKANGNVPSKDVFIPLFTEYLDVCKKYDKLAIIELKQTIRDKDIDKAIEEIREHYSLDRVIFISFYPGLLMHARRVLPTQKMQFLTENPTPEVIDMCIQHNFGVDSNYRTMNESIVKKFHDHGLEVNVYTVDDKDEVDRLIRMGCDYVTSNIVE